MTQDIKKMTHICGYHSNQTNCDQVFKTATAFNDHKMHNLCGFGIKGWKRSGFLVKTRSRNVSNESFVTINSNTNI
jgi:hypothetical protein